MLAVFFSYFFVFLLSLLDLLTLGPLYLSPHLLSRINSPILQLRLDPPSIVVRILILYKVTQVDKPFREIIILLSLE